MTHAELRHALGALCVDGPDGLWAAPSTEREAIDVLQVLKASGAALQREVRLSRARLSSVAPVEVTSGTVQVGAGVRLDALERTLRQHGLSLGPLSPGALQLTLGEFLEGPYAGLRPVRGGRLEPLTLSLTGVLADGQVVRTHGSPRSAAGPDLNALFLGAESRLGLVTQAVVRAQPLGETEQRLKYSLPGAAALVDWLRACLSDGALPDSVHAGRLGSRLAAEVVLSGQAESLARDAATLARRAEAIGGRPTGEVTGLSPTATEHEAGWSEMEAALEAGHALTLWRLSLQSVVVLGEVNGMRLDGEAAWPEGASGLRATLDRAAVLGGGR